MSKVVRMPSPSNRVTQQELRTLYDLEQAYMEARNRWVAQLFKVSQRLASGAHQEPGKYHLEKKVYHRRSISYKQIVVKLKGKDWVENLLRHTKSHTYPKWTFSDLPHR